MCSFRRRYRRRVEAIWQKLCHTFQDSCETEGVVEDVGFTPGLRRGEKVFVNCGGGLVRVSESVVASNRQVPFSRWYLRPLELR